MRLAFNSTFGLFGLLDMAAEMGLKKHNEDFGQTLGRWGVGAGPYLVLPFMGPSDIRDTAGFMVDSGYTDLVRNHDDVSTRNPGPGPCAWSAAAPICWMPSVAIDAAALDGYEFSRDLYLERRRGLVYDGKPPLVTRNEQGLRPGRRAGGRGRPRTCPPCRPAPRTT
jgi:phospholipid-binding lipoprotein MlaA